jgi:hypothetical protein
MGHRRAPWATSNAMPWNSPLHGRQRGWVGVSGDFLREFTGMIGWTFLGDELGSVTIIVTIMLVDYHNYYHKSTDLDIMK